MIAVIDLLQYRHLDQLFLVDSYRQLWPCAELEEHLTLTIGSDAVHVLLNTEALDPFKGRFDVRRSETVTEREPLKTAMELMHACSEDDLLLLRPAAGVVTVDRITSFLPLALKLGGAAVSSSPMHANLHPNWTHPLPEKAQSIVLDGFDAIIKPEDATDENPDKCANGSQFLTELVFVDKALTLLPKKFQPNATFSVVHCPVKTKPLLYAALYL